MRTMALQQLKQLSSDSASEVAQTIATDACSPTFAHNATVFSSFIGLQKVTLWSQFTMRRVSASLSSNSCRVTSLHPLSAGQGCDGRGLWLFMLNIRKVKSKLALSWPELGARYVTRGKEVIMPTGKAASDWEQL